MKLKMLTITKNVIVIIVFLGCFEIVNAQTTNYKSYAVLVSGIAKNFQWPANQLDFEIIVFGNSKVYNELLPLINQKKIEGVEVKVTTTDKIFDINSPKIIYLSDGKSSMLNEIMVRTQGKPIVIIAEREGLFKRGAGMSFVINPSNQLRLDINETDLINRNIKAPINVLMMLANEKI
jgi:hypothetical protein